MGRYRRRLQVFPVIALGFLLACCSGTTETVAAGVERGVCYPNGTCNQGLVCFSNRCVLYDASNATSPGDSSLSGTGGGDPTSLDSTSGGGGGNPGVAFDAGVNAAQDGSPGVGGAVADASSQAMCRDAAYDVNPATTTQHGPTCADGAEAGPARCPGADLGSLLLCDDFDVPDFFVPQFISHGSSTFACSPISPPFAYAFSVPKSDCDTIASGAWYGFGSPSFTARQSVRLAARVKLDATCANVANDKEATILEFVEAGIDYAYFYSVRLKGLIPSLEIRHGLQGEPQVARGKQALPTDTWLSIAEDLGDVTAELYVDDVSQGSESRGGIPPSALTDVEIYIGLNAPMGWSDCTITFDDLTLNRINDK